MEPASIAYVRCSLGTVIAVHPQAGDFAQGKIGRILISVKHGGGYHTTAQTTADDGPAQIEDQKVVISAYVEPVEADQEVYFEVIDPDDPVDNDNPAYQEDGNPVTPLLNAGALLPAPDDDPNDNRSMFGSTLDEYNDFQDMLSARSATTVLREIDGVERAVAEVTLTITNRHSGDNYIVRATTVDPDSKPFNENSWVKEQSADPDYACWAGIPEGLIQATTTLTAWKRVYIQTSKMFRHGSDLTADAQQNSNTVDVDDATGFAVNDTVLIFDNQDKDGETRTISAINGNVFTLNAALTKTFETANHGHAGQVASGFYEANTADLENLWAEAFVEVNIRVEGSGPCAFRNELPASDEALIAFSGAWFHLGTIDRPNYFHVIGARRMSGMLGFLGYVPFPAHPTNAAFVFIERIQGHYPAGDQPAVNRNVTAHEFTHLFDDDPVPGQVIGPDQPNRHHAQNNPQDGVVPAQNNGDPCIMNLGSDRTLTSRRCIFHVYSTRDETDAKQ